MAAGPARQPGPRDRATRASGARAGARCDPGAPGLKPFDPAFAARALALALRQTLEDSGRAGYVLGLSGGVDSAVAAALAARAVGPERVQGLFLPGSATSLESAAAARETAEALKIGLDSLELAPFLDGAPLPEDRVRRGNLEARLRMALLYDRAAESDVLVLGPGNKTELALGYTTLWGDMAADFWPLGDLYKSEVYQLAEWLELPAAVVEREPSAELWPGQTDEGELGVSYGVADRVLYYYLESRRRPDAIVAAGIPRDVVERVLERLRTSAHKRALPRIPKLSGRTIGLDVHYPRAWRGPA